MLALVSADNRRYARGIAGDVSSLGRRRPLGGVSTDHAPTTFCSAETRRYARLTTALSLGIRTRVGGVLCDVHCEAELAGGADLALFAGVVASADPFCRGWV